MVVSARFGKCHGAARSGGVVIGLLAVVLISTATTAQAAINKRVAVIMFKPQNYGTQWIDAATVRSVVWTGGNAADKFYREESFGKWALTGSVRADGDIYGWYTVPYDDVGTCLSSLSQWSWTAKQMAAKNGYVDANYESIIYVTTATNCPARAWTSGRTTTVISGFNPQTIVHELGHAFGLGHAGAWSCKDALGVSVSISSSCSAYEYGDFSVMGATTQYHMNNFHKGALGWLAASNTRDVVASGVYALYPIEAATSYVQVIRIPRKYDSKNNPLDYYYLEFRQVYGFDNFSSNDKKVTGISIRVAPSYVNKGSKTYLLDATTPGLTNFNDAQLAVGGVFNDTTRRVTITLLSITGGAAQVSIGFY